MQELVSQEISRFMMLFAAGKEEAMKKIRVKKTMIATMSYSPKVILRFAEQTREERGSKRCLALHTLRKLIYHLLSLMISDKQH